MSRGLVDIIVPTLWRPTFLEPFLDSLTDCTEDWHLVFVCQDSDQPSIDEAARLGVECVVVPAPDGPVSVNVKINVGYHNTSNPFFFLGSDDIRFTPGWLDRAFEKMTDTISVVGICDSIPSHVHEGELPGHVLIRRSYIEQFSGVVDQPNTVLHEGYQHFYSDIELWRVAAKRGCWASAWDSKITHLHPNDGSRDIDRTTEWTRGFLRHDMAVYEERKPLRPSTEGPMLASTLDS